MQILVLEKNSVLLDGMLSTCKWLNLKVEIVLSDLDD